MLGIVALLGPVGLLRAETGVAAAVEPSDELVPSPSVAQDARSPERAAADQSEGRRLYRESVRALELRDFDRAIEQLKASYRQAPAPALLYNLGQAYRLKGDCPEALAFYRRFMATNPVGVARERTEARIADMERCVAAIEADQKAAVAPGRATLAITPAAATNPGARGVDLSTRGPAVPRHGWRPVGLGVGVTALVLAAASGYFGWRATRAADDVSKMFASMDLWGRAGQDAESSVVLNDRLAIGTALGALLAGGLAGWAWWEAK